MGKRYEAAGSPVAEWDKGYVLNLGMGTRARVILSGIWVEQRVYKSIVLNWVKERKLRGRLGYMNISHK